MAYYLRLDYLALESLRAVVQICDLVRSSFLCIGWLSLILLQAADNIAVLDGGKIVEYGRHEELSKGTGLYSALVSSQSLALSGV